MQDGPVGQRLRCELLWRSRAYARYASEPSSCKVVNRTKFAGLALAWTSPLVAWLTAAGVFLLTVAILFAYWQRSLAEIQAPIRPLSSTPADEVGAPF